MLRSWKHHGAAQAGGTHVDLKLSLFRQLWAAALAGSRDDHWKAYSFLSLLLF